MTPRKKTTSTTTTAASSSSTPAKSNQTTSATIVKGRPKSGRVWKESKKRASSIVKSDKSWVNEKYNKGGEDRMRKVKELSLALHELRTAELEAKKNRTAQNKKLREENAKKSEVVQVIRNPAKLKRMKKKQLRKIEKRDTTIVDKSQKKS